MKLLVTLDPVPHAVPPSLALLREEVEHVWNLYQAGTVREVYSRGTQAGAVLMMEVADMAEGEAAVQVLPLVRAGSFTAQAIALTPFAPLASLFPVRQP